MSINTATVDNQTERHTIIFIVCRNKSYKNPSNIATFNNKRTIRVTKGSTNDETLRYDVVTCNNFSKISAVIIILIFIVSFESLCSCYLLPSSQPVAILCGVPKFGLFSVFRVLLCCLKSLRFYMILN